jgi:hypothetical protein
MHTQRTAGPFIIIKKDGTILKADELIPTEKGIVTKNEDRLETALLSITEIDVITTTDAKLETITGRTLMATALLKVEQVITAYNHYKNSNPTFGAKLPAIDHLIVFGSGSLNITILPNRVSHDLDLITNRRAWDMLAGELASINEGQTPSISLHTDDLLEHLPNWRLRTAILKGASGLPFLILHPLDTLCQKLLRTNLETFEKKDKADIALIIQNLKPGKKVLVQLLQEGFKRFFDPDETQREAATRNTTWFLSNFLPETNLQNDIIEPAKKQRLDILANQGLLPTPTPLGHWSQLFTHERLLEPKPPAPQM